MRRRGRGCEGGGRVAQSRRARLRLDANARRPRRRPAASAAKVVALGVALATRLAGLESGIAHTRGYIRSCCSRKGCTYCLVRALLVPLTIRFGVMAREDSSQAN